MNLVACCATEARTAVYRSASVYTARCCRLATSHICSCLCVTSLTADLAMAWGAKGGRGVDDLVDRLRRNDPSLTSLHIFASRRFGREVRRAGLTLKAPHLRARRLMTRRSRLQCLNHLTCAGSPKALCCPQSQYNIARAVCKRSQADTRDGRHVGWHAGHQHLFDLFLHRG